MTDFNNDNIISLNIEYPAKLWPDHDTLIKKAAGRYSDASGMGFGVRDMQFYCDTVDEAEKLLKKIKKAVAKLTISISY
jgi:hypothetical protein